MHRAFAALGFVAAVMALPAEACRCSFLSLPEYFGAADHVFLAEIQEVDVKRSVDNHYRVVTKFLPLETFKGSPGDLTSIRSREDECNVSHPLTSGKQALVFIRNGMAEPCGGTRRYEANRDRHEIKQLRQLKQQYKGSK